MVMLAGGAGKQVTSTDAASWMGPLGHTESSLCPKDQTRPYFHEFINFHLILDGVLLVFCLFFFVCGFLLLCFGFFFGSHHPMGTAVDRTLQSVVCAYRKESCQVSHLCQGAVKKKENLACYYCAYTGHN